MRRLLIATTLAALIASVLATPVGAQGGLTCSDFESQAIAQRYFFDKGGAPTNNVNGLDADGDGWACERNPPPYFSGFSAAQVNEGDVVVDDDGQSAVGDDDDNDAPAAVLPRSGTGGYLSTDALSLSPLMLLGSVVVLGATMVAGGLRVRRSVR